MQSEFEVRYASSPTETAKQGTKELRNNFLIQNLFVPNQIKFTYSHYDRYVVAGAMPTSKSITLRSIDPLKAEFFLERREMGIINVGETGMIKVEGEIFSLGYKEALYIGKGNREVEFSSQEESNPAKFYINSAPAHKTYPTKKITKNEAEIVDMGSLENSNARTINKLIVQSMVKTCQLQMGMTELKAGSIWNTMPAHVHDRRMEVYFYFEVPENQAVSHFMGQPDETRHIWVVNNEAVISPPWSIHAGAGTNNYTFIWGMAGENLDYDDMDKAEIKDLK